MKREREKLSECGSHRILEQPLIRWSNSKCWSKESYNRWFESLKLMKYSWCPDIPKHMPIVAQNRSFKFGSSYFRKWHYAWIKYFFLIVNNAWPVAYVNACVDIKFNRWEPSCGWLSFLENIVLKIFFVSPSVVSIFGATNHRWYFLSI